MHMLRNVDSNMEWCSVQFTTSEVAYTFTPWQFPNPVLLKYILVSQNSVTLLGVYYVASVLNSKWHLFAACCPVPGCISDSSCLFCDNLPLQQVSVAVIDTLWVLDSCPLKPCKTPSTGTSLFFKDLIPRVSLVLLGRVKSTAVVCGVSVFPGSH